MTDNIIKTDKLVELTYSISAQGQVFEQVDIPVNYIHGQDSGMHEKIEQALDGKAEGDVIEVPLTVREGFGEVDQAMIFEDNISNVPEQFREVGARADFKNENGDVKSFTVAEINGDIIRFDGNHPLAGKDLVFKVRILQVRDASVEELSGAIPTGQSAGMPENNPTIN